MGSVSPNESNSDPEEEFFIVDKILDVDIKNNMIKYKIRWEGYTADDDTWEPEENLDTGAPGVAQLLRKFKMTKSEKIRKLKETLATKMKSHRQSWYCDWDTSEDSSKKLVTDNNTFFDEDVPKITGEKKKLLGKAHKYTDTELLLPEITSRERITQTQMKELRGNGAVSSDRICTTVSNESVIPEACSASSTLRRKRNAADVNDSNKTCSTVRTDSVDSAMDINYDSPMGISTDDITKGEQSGRRKSQKRSFWEYESEMDENEHSIERKLDDDDLFFGEKVADLKAPLKKLADKDHKMSSTEMILANLDIDYGRMTRQQMKMLSTSSPTIKNVDSSIITPVSKAKSKRNLIIEGIAQVKQTFPRGNTASPVFPTGYKKPTENTLLEKKEFPIITNWEEYRKNKEKMRNSILDAA